MIETKRLLLRPWLDMDVKQLYELAKDENVGPNCGWMPHKNIEESNFVLKNILQVEETYAIILKEEQVVVGCISLLNHTKSTYANDGEYEVGYWLGQTYWKRGIMQEAVQCIIHYAWESLHAKRLWCAYFSHNEKSRKIQEKCGFIHYKIDPQVKLPLIHKQYDIYVQILEK